MTELYVATILLAVTFLLICWVVTEFQIYNDSHSMEEELRKPRLSSRISTGWNMVLQALRDARYFRQETLKEENRTMFLFGVKRRNKKEERRSAGSVR